MSGRSCPGCNSSRQERKNRRTTGGGRRKRDGKQAPRCVGRVVTRFAAGVEATSAATDVESPTLRLVRAVLVVNPQATATTPAGRDVLAHALASQVKLDVVETDYRGHAMAVARAAASDGVDLVVAHGGDGTVNEVVNGLLSITDGKPNRYDEVPMLGVVPGGSANVFARNLGLPRDPVEATHRLLNALEEGRGRQVGLGRADDRWFTFNAGMGWDADVVAAVDRRRGKRTSPWSVLTNGGGVLSASSAGTSRTDGARPRCGARHGAHRIRLQHGPVELSGALPDTPQHRVLVRLGSGSFRVDRARAADGAAACPAGVTAAWSTSQSAFDSSRRCGVSQHHSRIAGKLAGRRRPGGSAYSRGVRQRAPCAHGCGLSIRWTPATGEQQSRDHLRQSRRCHSATGTVRSPHRFSGANATKGQSRRSNTSLRRVS